MPNVKHRPDFLGTAEAEEIKKRLMLMVESDTFSTSGTFTSDSEQYPDNVVPFVDKHIRYLYTHPKLDVEHYLANLRLMTRKR